MLFVFGEKREKLKRDWLTGGLLSGAAHRNGALSCALHRGADCSGSGVCVYARALIHIKNDMKNDIKTEK